MPDAFPGRSPRRPHLIQDACTLSFSLSRRGFFRLTAAAAYPAATFYGDERLVPVMYAIGAAWLVYGFENIGIVNFRREMNFSAEFRLMATKRVIAFIATIAAAVLLRSYWALVIGMAVGRVSGVALSYMMHPYRPHLSLARARELFSFSGWVLVNNVVGVVLNKIPHFFVGRVFGAQAIGTYAIAAEIAQLAQTELIAPVNRAMFPGYSRLVDDPAAFRRTCVAATAAVLAIVLPISVGVAVLAGPFVRLLLGANWSGAVPIIEVLAYAGAVSAITSNNVSAYLALGRPHLATATLVARLAVLAAAAAILYRTLGMLGVAYAELCASVASMAVSLPTLFLTMKLGVGEYLAAVWRPVLASALMGVAITYLVDPAVVDPGVGGAAWQMIVGVPTGFVIYPLCLAALWWVSGRPESIEVLIVRRILDALPSRRAGNRA